MCQAVHTALLRMSITQSFNYSSGQISVFNFFYVCDECFAWMYVYSRCTEGALRGEKRTRDVLELEWQIVWAIIWVLVSEPGPSVRTKSTISLASIGQILKGEKGEIKYNSIIYFYVTQSILSYYHFNNQPLYLFINKCPWPIGLSWQSHFLVF